MGFLNNASHRGGEAQWRNYGFWNEPTQQAINNLTIGLAGTGGTGNAFGTAVIRMGVCRVKGADPEELDESNGNRVPAVRADTIGRNKVEVLSEDILAINPSAEVKTYKEGITPDNVRDFVGGVDVILNGLELTNPELGVMLAREARSRQIGGRATGVPVIDVEYIGHAGQGYVIDPTSKMTFERLMGLDVDDRDSYDGVTDKLRSKTVHPSRYLAYLPPYGDLRVLQAIQDGAPFPSNAIGASVATSIAMAEMLKIARKKVGERGLEPTYAPRVRWYDAYTGKSGTTKHPRVSYYRHLAGVVARNMLNRHEPASYTPEERAARGDY